MPQLRISDTFFRNERERAYSDWELAVWRELFQNSIDQKVRRIDITLTQEGDLVRLIFADDGPGMSRTVLEEVYFSLGATTKDNDPSMIGGFGRARILTCFAMCSYTIISQDYKADGCREQYEIHDHVWTNGCRLEIIIDDTSLSVMQAKLERFLAESRLDARLYLNGELLPNRSGHLGRHVRDLELDGETYARVWVNKSSDQRSVIVRVNGVAMFTAGSASAQVIIELVPELSRKVLTATRDGLHWRYERPLRRFLEELAVDTRSAIRSRKGRHTTMISNGGMKRIHKPAGPVHTAHEDRLGTQEAAFHDERRRPSEPAHRDDVITVTSLAQVDPFDAWFGRTFGDIYVFDETDNDAIRKVIRAYRPPQWISLTIKGKSHRRGGNIIRLLLLWKTAIHYALEVALEPLGQTHLNYAVGFSFKDQINGADHREQDGGHVFCFNPVDATGKMNFAISQWRDLKRLMTLAKHEVTHVQQSWHDEDFSAMREQIDMVFDEAECRRRMKTALRNAII